MWALTIGWLAALVIFLVLEAETMGLVSIWFAAGSLVALLVSLVTDRFLVQLAFGLVASAICLAALRPVLKRRLAPGRQQRTNADRVIGMQGVVTEDIDNIQGRGAVIVRGQTWTARSESGALIPRNARVRILRIEGVKLFVEPLAVAEGAEQS